MHSTTCIVVDMTKTKNNMIQWSEAERDQILVDQDGTVWFHDPRRDEFRYLTGGVTKAELSWDGYHLPLETEGLYTKLDGPAARVFARVIDQLLEREQPSMFTVVGALEVSL